MSLNLDQHKNKCSNRCVFGLLSLKYLADADALKLLLEMKMKKRQEKPTLPSTVTELATEEGSKVYVVGTAHFSDSSKRDVVKVGEWSGTSWLFLA